MSFEIQRGEGGGGGVLGGVVCARARARVCVRVIYFLHLLILGGFFGSNIIIVFKKRPMALSKLAANGFVSVIYRAASIRTFAPQHADFAV